MEKPKEVKFIVVLSEGYDHPKLTIRLPDNGSIRDAIKAAGFELGNRVKLVLDPDYIQ